MVGELPGSMLKGGPVRAGVVDEGEGAVVATEDPHDVARVLVDLHGVAHVPHVHQVVPVIHDLDGVRVRRVDDGVGVEGLLVVGHGQVVELVPRPEDSAIRGNLLELVHVDRGVAGPLGADPRRSAHGRAIAVGGAAHVGRTSVELRGVDVLKHDAQEQRSPVGQDADVVLIGRPGVGRLPDVEQVSQVVELVVGPRSVDRREGPEGRVIEGRRVVPSGCF